MTRLAKSTPVWKYVIIYVTLIIVTVITVFPVVLVFGISLRPGNMLWTTDLSPVPENATFDAYRTIFYEKPFLRWLFNSTIVSFMVTVVGVSLASTAGYAFSRYKFAGREAGMIALIATQMFPVTMLLLPLFLMLIKLKVYDTFLGLVIAYSATALPFCIWQMKGYYDTIPYSLEEAAAIDGCGRIKTFYQIVLPLASPALVITALFSFMSAWSEYLVAAVILIDKRLYTLPLGLKQFQSNFDTEWGLYAAGAVIVCIPVVALFLFLSRWLISGLTLGSVKG
ncbi:MAG: sugar ABC transporter permease [candidate division KSB1 bacterium]|nr:sugar ABC transporter permease [candidate division KSB1 bacterium]MDZ7366339.1 sugar ABC transporter permease [candidate division KSB1 bacterium]MDZ7403994.1 sugar ABC transporter permease [candidate division KSB1 bacterium]